MLGCNSAQAQERWFQIEVSVFTNEATADRLEENWQAKRTQLSFPERLRKLDDITDILLIDEFMPPAKADILDEAPAAFESAPLTLPVDTPEPTREELILQSILATNPSPKNPGLPFKFFDLDRDDYLRLPSAQRDFTQTNRTLERSPNHRLLWHGAWRQAVLPENEAQAVYVVGGERYNERPELEGSLTIRFNENADRVVIDTNLWLAEYSPAQSTITTAEMQLEENTWQLPMHSNEGLYSKQQKLDSAIELDQVAFDIERIYHMVQSRGMRSSEFHYLDHPAIGVVVMVNPYEVPRVTLPFDSSSLEPSLTQ
jgi:hypothetical protein